MTTKKETFILHRRYYGLLYKILLLINKLTLMGNKALLHYFNYFKLQHNYRKRNIKIAPLIILLIIQDTVDYDGIT